MDLNGPKSDGMVIEGKLDMGHQCRCDVDRERIKKMFHAAEQHGDIVRVLRCDLDDPESVHCHGRYCVEIIAPVDAVAIAFCFG